MQTKTYILVNHKFARILRECENVAKMQKQSMRNVLNVQYHGWWSVDIVEFEHRYRLFLSL